MAKKSGKNLARKASRKAARKKAKAAKSPARSPETGRAKVVEVKAHKRSKPVKKYRAGKSS